MLGTGVGGGITGKGAHILIGDDLVKNWEEAISETIREKIWNFWTSTARTRLAPGGGILLIMTRWHEDDIAGRLLKKMETSPLARKWKIINFPAIAEHDEPKQAPPDWTPGSPLAEGTPLFRKTGEALHPERYPIEELREIENDVGPRVWISLYQQKPRPLGGQYIQSAWFKTITPDQIPKEANRWVRFWDLAVKAANANDETASVRIAVVRSVPEGGRHPVTSIYARNMLAYKKEWPESKRTIITFARAEKILVGIENNAAFEIAVHEIRNELRGQVQVQGVTVSQDKLTRAIPWIDIAEAGRFYVVDDGTGWISPFFAECEAWDPMQPKQQDNRIDSVSGGYQMTGVQLVAKVFV
jgi:predicted phage terminase large subunit-like protein